MVTVCCSLKPKLVAKYENTWSELNSGDGNVRCGPAVAEHGTDCPAALRQTEFAFSQSIRPNQFCVKLMGCVMVPWFATSAPTMDARAQISARERPVVAVANCATTEASSLMGSANPLLSGLDRSMHPIKVQSQVETATRSFFQQPSTAEMLLTYHRIHRHNRGSPYGWMQELTEDWPAPYFQLRSELAAWLERRQCWQFGPTLLMATAAVRRFER